MGKVGRFACIFVPMALTIASLITLLVVFLAGTNKNDANLRAMWFFKADTSQFKANGTAGIANLVDKIPGVNKDIANSLLNSVVHNDLADEYYIYLWNYCTGSKTNGSSTTNITYCSPRKAQFYFNPIQVWGLNNTGIQNAIPKELNSAIDAYSKASKLMFIAYAVAFFTTAASIIVGLLGICSRLGSLCNSIVSSIATLFTILAAITSTALFSIVVGGLNTALKPYQVKSAVGTRMLAADWIAVAFSISATLFWLISSCCCSGKSSRRDRKNRDSDLDYKAGYGGFGSRGYQPLDDQHHHRQQPYGAPATKSGLEMQDFGHTSAGPYKGRETAYEPFRQV